MSWTIVFAITAILSPLPNSLLAFFFALLALLKKYFTFFLCIISNTVPKITSATIITTKDCIPINGTVSDKIENGLVENIKFIKSLY